jgi:hypothetical protein
MAEVNAGMAWACLQKVWADLVLDFWGQLAKIEFCVVCKYSYLIIQAAYK